MLAGNLAKLLCDEIVEEIVGDDPDVGGVGDGNKPVDGLLNHGAFAVESQNLLGARFSTARPEPRSTATCENHRSELLLRLTALNRHTPPSYLAPGCTERIRCSRSADEARRFQN
jgi:hypothetical protein